MIVKKTFSRHLTDENSATDVFFDTMKKNITKIEGNYYKDDIKYTVTFVPTDDHHIFKWDTDRISINNNQVSLEHFMNSLAGDEYDVVTSILYNLAQDPLFAEIFGQKVDILCTEYLELRYKDNDLHIPEDCKFVSLGDGFDTTDHTLS